MSTPAGPGRSSTDRSSADGVVFRDMALEDVPAVNALEQRLFPADAWPLEMFLAELSQPETRRYSVAESGGEIVGYAGLMCIEPIADVQTIAVVPEFEGRGIGSALLTRLIDEARRRRAADVLLEVREDNPRAQQLYVRFGFEQIHVRPQVLPRRRRRPHHAAAAGARRRDPRHCATPPTQQQQPDNGSRTGMNRSQPLVLGIESSCDETGVGIVRGTTLLTNTVSSSMDEHVRFGGVIPEIASRAHLDAFVPTLRQALADAGRDAGGCGRHRGHLRPRARRRPHGGSVRREGPGRRHRQTALRHQPPGGARRRRAAGR